MQKTNKKTVCIIGMHRSGTSLLANLLQLGGIYLGEDKDLIGANYGNIFGHFEPAEIVYLNETLLAKLGGDWKNPPVLQKDWLQNNEIKALEPRAQSIIQDFYANAEVLGFKDPRFCITLPFWQRFFYNPQYLLIFRNPLEVAHSLLRRDNMPIADGLMCWLQYNQAALHNLKGEKFFIVRNRDIVNHSNHAISNVFAFLGITITPEIMNEILLTIEPAVEHSRFDDEAVANDPQVPDEVKKLYTSIIQLYDKQNQQFTSIEDPAINVNKDQQIKFLKKRLAQLDELIKGESLTAKNLRVDLENNNKQILDLQAKISNLKRLRREDKIYIAQQKQLLDIKTYEIFKLKSSQWYKTYKKLRGIKSKISGVEEET